MRGRVFGLVLSDRPRTLLGEVAFFMNGNIHAIFYESFCDGIETKKSFCFKFRSQFKAFMLSQNLSIHYNHDKFCGYMDIHSPKDCGSSLEV